MARLTNREIAKKAFTKTFMFVTGTPWRDTAVFASKLTYRGVKGGAKLAYKGAKAGYNLGRGGAHLASEQAFNAASAANHYASDPTNAGKRIQAMWRSDPVAPITKAALNIEGDAVKNISIAIEGVTRNLNDTAPSEGVVDPSHPLPKGEVMRFQISRMEAMLNTGAELRHLAEETDKMFGAAFDRSGASPEEREGVRRKLIEASIDIYDQALRDAPEHAHELRAAILEGAGSGHTLLAEMTKDPEQRRRALKESERAFKSQGEALRQHMIIEEAEPDAEKSRLSRVLGAVSAGFQKLDDVMEGRASKKSESEEGPSRLRRVTNAIDGLFRPNDEQLKNKLISKVLSRQPDQRAAQSRLASAIYNQGVAVHEMAKTFAPVMNGPRGALLKESAALHLQAFQEYEGGRGNAEGKAWALRSLGETRVAIGDLMTRDGKTMAASAYYDTGGAALEAARSEFRKAPGALSPESRKVQAMLAAAARSARDAADPELLHDLSSLADQRPTRAGGMAELSAAINQADEAREALEALNAGLLKTDDLARSPRQLQQVIAGRLSDMYESRAQPRSAQREVASALREFHSPAAIMWRARTSLVVNRPDPQTGKSASVLLNDYSGGADLYRRMARHAGEYGPHNRENLLKGAVKLAQETVDFHEQSVLQNGASPAIVRGWEQAHQELGRALRDYAVVRPEVEAISLLEASKSAFKQSLLVREALRLQPQEPPPDLAQIAPAPAQTPASQKNPEAAPPSEPSLDEPVLDEPPRDDGDDFEPDYGSYEASEADHSHPAEGEAPSPPDTAPAEGGKAPAPAAAAPPVNKAAERRRQREAAKAGGAAPAQEAPAAKAPAEGKAPASTEAAQAAEAGAGTEMEGAKRPRKRLGALAAKAAQTEAPELEEGVELEDAPEPKEDAKPIGAAENDDAKRPRKRLGALATKATQTDAPKLEEAVAAARPKTQVFASAFAPPASDPIAAMNIKMEMARTQVQIAVLSGGEDRQNALRGAMDLYKEAFDTSINPNDPNQLAMEAQARLGLGVTMGALADNMFGKGEVDHALWEGMNAAAMEHVEAASDDPAFQNVRVGDFDHNDMLTRLTKDEASQPPVFYPPEMETSLNESYEQASTPSMGM